MSESNGTPHKAFLTTRPFPIQFEEGQEPKQYTVRTMKNKEKTDWQNFVSGNMKYTPSGKPQGVSKFDGLESSLITKCLRDPDGNPVPQSVIDDWPAPLVTALFKECQDVNGLTPEAEAAAKN